MGGDMSRWAIAGQPEDAVPVVGATYEVDHKIGAKDSFTVKVTKVNKGWLYGEFAKGDSPESDLVAAAASLCTLTLKEPPCS